MQMQRQFQAPRKHRVMKESIWMILRVLAKELAKTEIVEFVYRRGKQMVKN